MVLALTLYECIFHSKVFSNLGPPDGLASRLSHAYTVIARFSVRQAKAFCLLASHPRPSIPRFHVWSAKAACLATAKKNPLIRLAPNLCTTSGRSPSRLLPCLYTLCARYEQVRLFVCRMYFVSACVGCDGSKFKEIICSYAVRTGILGTTMRLERLKCESLWGATWSQPVAAAVWLLSKLSNEHELLESLFGMMRCIARKK